MKFVQYRHSALMRAAVVAASALLAVTGAVSAQENWDDVVAKAREEGRVVFYNTLQPNGVEPLLKRFREDYPEIQTESIRLTSNALQERFSTEFNAGRHLSDVVITFSDRRLHEGVKQGWALQWSPPEAANFSAELIEDDTLFTLQQARDAIIWNTTLVKPEDEPKEWADLFDPKWKGKVAMNPPWRSVAIQQIVAFWEDQLQLGDTAQKLKDNNVRFFEGSSGIIQAVIRGDVYVAELTDLPLNPLLEDGAPVGFVYPESGTTLSSNKAFIAKNAPHPNAAKVFMNWLMTEKGQTYLQQYAGLPVTRNGAPPLSKLPATKELKNAINYEPLLTSERQAQMVNHWRTVFGVK